MLKKFKLILIVASFIGCSTSKNHNISKLLTPLELQQLLNLNKDVQLIDVRTPQEFKEGHISNATNIDYQSEDFSERIKTLDKAKPVIVYCMSGGRSSKSITLLKTLQFNKLYNLKGGIIRWTSEGFEVKK